MDSATPEDVDVTGANEDLARANEAFDQGNYRRVRELTDALVKSGDPRVAAAAASLRQRIGVDRIQIFALIGCLLLFLTIGYIYVIQ